MSPSLHHVLDTVIVAVVTLSTAASTIILGSAESSDQFAEIKLLLLPFLGALIMSGGIIMLNPQIETRRIVIGRSIVALFCGTIAPQLIAVAHPSLASLSIKPIIQLAFGGLIACLAYVLSKPFTNQLYRRADGIAAREAERLEDRFSPKREKKGED